MNEPEGVPELQGPPGVVEAIDKFLADVDQAILARRPERKLLAAPWTDEQVAALNAYQRLSNFHPYTCPYAHDWRTRRLVATEEGWVCAHPNCGYTQNWAHDRAARLGRGDVGE